MVAVRGFSSGIGSIHASCVMQCPLKLGPLILLYFRSLPLIAVHLNALPDLNANEGMGSLIATASTVALLSVVVCLLLELQDDVVLTLAEA